MHSWRSAELRANNSGACGEMSGQGLTAPVPCGFRGRPVLRAAPGSQAGGSWLQAAALTPHGWQRPGGKRCHTLAASQLLGWGNAEWAAPWPWGSGKEGSRVIATCQQPESHTGSRHSPLCPELCRWLPFIHLFKRQLEKSPVAVRQLSRELLFPAQDANSVARLFFPGGSGASSQSETVSYCVLLEGSEFIAK